MRLYQGVGIDPLQVQSQAQTVVIDANTQRRLFPHQKNVVGEVILVGNMPATVVGVPGEAVDVRQQERRWNVWVPYSTMANRLMGNNYFDSITVRIRDGLRQQGRNSSCHAC